MIRDRILSAVAVIIAWGVVFWTILEVRPAAPAAPTCQLSLTLLMDTSASVKAEQRTLIREGTAWALAHPVLEPSLVGTGVIVRVVDFMPFCRNCEKRAAP